MDRPSFRPYRETGSWGVWSTGSRKSPPHTSQRSWKPRPAARRGKKNAQQRCRRAIAVRNAYRCVRTVLHYLRCPFSLFYVALRRGIVVRKGGMLRRRRRVGPPGARTTKAKAKEKALGEKTAAVLRSPSLLILAFKAITSPHRSHKQ